MNGKTYLIKGTLNGKAFMIWEYWCWTWTRFEDAAKDFTVNGNDIVLNFKIHLDAIMAKLITLANQKMEQRHPWQLSVNGDELNEVY
jgi:hypothetical protein